jgi:hypothetical protein
MMVKIVYYFLSFSDPVGGLEGAHIPSSGFWAFELYTNEVFLDKGILSRIYVVPKNTKR